MDPISVAKAMKVLGITGMDPTRVAAAMELAQALGEQVSIDEEDVQAYFPEEREESIYIPKMPSKNFYYDQKTIKNLVTPNLSHLASLHTPNLERLRKLGGL